MSANGSNNWGVPFSSIQFVERILRAHNNVDSFDRSDDIIFNVKRLKQGDEVKLVCIEEYTASLASVRRVVEEFGKVQLIYVGGKWNSVTSEAQRFCDENEIGIYNAGGLSPALRRDRYWREDRSSKAEPEELDEWSA